MSHSFSLKVDEELSLVLEKVKTAITSNGGMFTGTEQAGAFSGKSPLGPIKGEYRSVSENEIQVVITHKPLLVPYGIIESEIRSYFC